MKYVIIANCHTCNETHLIEFETLEEFELHRCVNGGCVFAQSETVHKAFIRDVLQDTANSVPF